MANRRVSELAADTNPQPGDLLLLSDVAAYESKKLTLADLKTFVLAGGSITGSLSGTASYANHALIADTVLDPSASYALTASFALNGGTGVGNVASSSWASQSLSSSYSTYAVSTGNVVQADSASLAYAAQYAGTASYLYYSGGNNGKVQTAVIALTATTAVSASWASSSISASYVNIIGTVASASHANYADTAGTALIGIITNVQSSASWASHSLDSEFASTADQASNAIFAITASYSFGDGSALYSKGVYLALTQSRASGQLDIVNINPISNQYVMSSVEAIGTVIAYYTSSIILDESVSLYVLDRNTGVTTLLDSTPIYVNIQGQYSSITASMNAYAVGANITGSITGSTIGYINGLLTGYLTSSFTSSFTGSVGGSDASGSMSGSMTGSVNGNLSGSYTGSVTSSISAIFNGQIQGSVTGSVSALLSGSIKFPFSLMGQTLMTGSYTIYVSASSNIGLEPTRLTRFNITSTAGDFSISSGGNPIFTTDNTASLFSYTIAGPTTLVGSASQVVAAGPANILALQATSSLISTLYYPWTLTNLKYLDCNSNSSMNNIGWMPTSIVTMSLNNCNLSTLPSLIGTSASILNVNTNYITSIDTLPASMSYLDVSYNPITNMPATLPYGLTDLYCNSTNIAIMPGSPFKLADSIVSMSFNGNFGLVTWLSTLPTGLISFSCNYNSILTALPTIPVYVTYLDVSNNALPATTAIFNICSQLAGYSAIGGTLNISGNPGVPGSLLPATSNDLATLVGRGWTIIT